MIFFAQLDSNNTVIRIVEINDKFSRNFRTEEDGKKYCNQTYGEGSWLQAFLTLDGKRGLTGINFYYDKETDKFLPPRPFKSFIFNYKTKEWEAPVKMPVNPGINYKWDEDKVKWVPDLPSKNLSFITSTQPNTAAQPVVTIIK